MLLSLIFDNTLSGQLPYYPITELPNYPITPLPNHPNAQSPNNQADLSIYLPSRGEIGSWQPTGSPEKAVGEDLFVLINGGAEIYHEYGFKQVVMQSYENMLEKSINLEIYEMENCASAFGIYSFKTSSRGKELPLGDKALLEDYYLNFWKGDFLVTITGFDSEQETIDGLITIANAVASKIKGKGQFPLLIDLLPGENLNKASIKYLKGNLALFNYYDFGTGGIFGLKEGVIGDYGKHKVFIFKYDNKIESEKWFKNATSHLKSDAKFVIDEISGKSENFVFRKDEHQIIIKLRLKYIIVVVGTLNTNANEIIEQVESNIEY